VALFNSGELVSLAMTVRGALAPDPRPPIGDVLQSFLQIAVAHLHLERAIAAGHLLLGEGLGRLAPFPPAVCLGLNLAHAAGSGSGPLAVPQGTETPRNLPAQLQANHIPGWVRSAAVIC